MGVIQGLTGAALGWFSGLLRAPQSVGRPNSESIAGSAVRGASNSDTVAKVRSMDEKGAPVEQKGDLSEPVANNTPSKPRQTGHPATKKQPRAAKQLRFEAHSGHGASKSTAGAPTNGHMLTTDAAAQADLNTGPLTASHYPSHQQPQSQAPPARNASHPTMEVHAVHTRDIAVGSGSDGSQPKRRKRTTAAKNAHARANGGYGNHASHAPHTGYGHHPIHGHYMHSGDYEIGHGHTTKNKKQAVHRTPKQDDKGPCLNPACRTTDTPQWRLGPMFCRELCNRCGTRWQRAKNTRNPQGFFVWVRNDLRSQGLEVPDAVARPAASPELALAALREVENQPHAGRQHKTEEPEISDDDEDVEQEGDIGGRYEEEIMEGEEEESDMSAPEIVTHHRGGHRRPQPRRQAVPYDLLPHQKGHRTVHRGTAEHFPEAALRMGHLQHDDEDSGASEADLLCSEVLSESHDEASDVGSDEMYARRHYRIPQGYYDEDMDSEMTESQVDEEVAVTKRGRAVKMPAKYKAEVEKMHQRKRKAEDSPEGRRYKRHPYATEWGPPPVNYDSPQRMYRGAGHLPPRAVVGSPLSRPSGKVSKSHGSPLGRSDQVARAHMSDRRAREAAYAAAPSRVHMGYGRPQHAPYPRPPSVHLDEADNDAVDALMGMTGMVYAH